MQITNIDFKETIQKAKTSLQQTGQKTSECLRFLNNQADTFIKNKGKDPKALKELGLGAIVTVAATILACSCIKGIFNKIKDVIKK